MAAGIEPPFHKPAVQHERGILQCVRFRLPVMRKAMSDIVFQSNGHHGKYLQSTQQNEASSAQVDDTVCPLHEAEA